MSFASFDKLWNIGNMILRSLLIVMLEQFYIWINSFWKPFRPIKSKLKQIQFKYVDGLMDLIKRSSIFVFFYNSLLMSHKSFNLHYEKKRNLFNDYVSCRNVIDELCIFVEIVDIFLMTHNHERIYLTIKLYWNCV